MVSTRKRQQSRSPSKKSERDYDQQKYWNDRYTAQLKGKQSDDHTDEWYFSYADISDVLKSYLKQLHRRSPVLDIGCGLSRIFDELVKEHFTGPFVGIDYSTVVINQCKKNKRDKYSYIALDMMKQEEPSLPFKSFGLIIDKGTTDGILCDRTHLDTISNMYEHASRLLSSNGLFVIVTIKSVEDREWFEDCLLRALIRGSENAQTKFIIHFHQCVSYTDGSENGPNIFVIAKYDCKSYSLRSTEHRLVEDVSHLVTVKCY